MEFENFPIPSVMLVIFPISSSFSFPSSLTQLRNPFVLTPLNAELTSVSLFERLVSARTAFSVLLLIYIKGINGIVSHFICPSFFTKKIKGRQDLFILPALFMVKLKACLHELQACQKCVSLFFLFFFRKYAFLFTLFFLC